MRRENVALTDEKAKLETDVSHRTRTLDYDFLLVRLTQVDTLATLLAGEDSEAAIA